MLNCAKMKAFADGELNVTRITISVFVSPD